jgi:hypothetical protein
MAAIEAAVAAGYGIEIDVQLSSDGRAMVFHDDTLDRLTAETGRSATARRPTWPRSRLPRRRHHPPAAEVLGRVAGRVPLLVEVKDQDGAMGPNVGALERAVASTSRITRGPSRSCRSTPIRSTRCATTPPRAARAHDLRLAARGLARRPRGPCARLRDIPDFARTGSSFISHQCARPRPPPRAGAQGGGLPVLCWTIRSPQAEADRAARWPTGSPSKATRAALRRLDARGRGPSSGSGPASPPRIGSWTTSRIEISVLGSLAEVDPRAWDACACPEAADGGRPRDPFTTHRFLKALEDSRSVGTGTGWQPRHLVAERGGAR